MINKISFKILDLALTTHYYIPPFSITFTHTLTNSQDWQERTAVSFKTTDIEPEPYLPEKYLPSVISIPKVLAKSRSPAR